MPSYEDQLAMYRQQLQAASAPIAPVAAPANPGMAETVALAFNTLRSDLAGLAELVRSVPSVPHIIDITPSAAYFQPGGLAMSAASTAGVVAPPMSINAAEYQRASNLHMASTMGDIAQQGSMTFGAVAAGVGGSIVEEAVFGGVLSASMRSAMYHGGISGARTGAALLGGSKGLGALIAGGRIGGTAGTVLGGAAGGAAGVALAAAPAALAWYGISEAASEAMQFTEARSQMGDYLQQTSWRYMGGRGFDLGDRRSISRDLAYEAINDRDFGYDEIQGILQTGTEMGMFNATQNADDFKRKFKELKDGLKAVASTMKVSLEEGVQLMSELKQGGFYTGAGQGAAAMMTAGMGFAGGYSAREMHEVGMRGAAMFRGTGISTRFGFELAQANVASVSQLQRMGGIDQETINQMGGTVGAGMQMTSMTGRFIQNPIGRAVTALMASGKGGTFNQDAALRLIAGESITDVMATTDIDAMNLTPVSAAKALDALGPQGMQIAMTSAVGAEARRIAEMYPGMTQESAFYHAAKQMGVASNAQEMQALYGYYKKAPQLIRAQAESYRDQMRRRSADMFERQNTLWERSGAGEATRWASREVIAPLTEPFTELGQWIEDTAADVGRWLRGVELIEEGPSDKRLLFEAAMSEVGPKSSREMGPRTLEKLQRMGKAKRVWGSDLEAHRKAGRAVSTRGGGFSAIDLLVRPEIREGILGSGFVAEYGAVEGLAADAAMFRAAQTRERDNKFWETDAGGKAMQAAEELLALPDVSGSSLMARIASESSKGAGFDKSFADALPGTIRAFAKKRGLKAGDVAAAVSRKVGISDELMGEFTTSPGVVMSMEEAKADRETRMGMSADDILADFEIMSGRRLRAGIGYGENRAAASSAERRKEDISGKFTGFLKEGGYSLLYNAAADMEKGTFASKHMIAKLVKDHQMSPEDAANIVDMAEDTAKRMGAEGFRKTLGMHGGAFREDISAKIAKRFAQQIASGAEVGTVSAKFASDLEGTGSLMAMSKKIIGASDEEIAGLDVDTRLLAKRIRGLGKDQDMTAELTPELRKQLQSQWEGSSGMAKGQIREVLASSKTVEQAAAGIGANLIAEAEDLEGKAAREERSRIQDKALIEEMRLKDPAQAKMLEALNKITTILSAIDKRKNNG